MTTKGKLKVEETQATEMAQSENHRLTIQHVPVSPWLTLSSEMTHREKKKGKEKNPPKNLLTHTKWEMTD
jgi:hypothetical protein